MLHHIWQLPATKQGLLGRKATGIIYHYNRITSLQKLPSTDRSQEALNVYKQKNKMGNIITRVLFTTTLTWLGMPGATCQIVLAGG